MASNPYVNRVDYVAGGVTHTLIDITSDTVTPSTLLQGYTAHDASGAAIVGTAQDNTFVVTVSGNEQTEMWEPDCTYAEVLAAVISGKEIVMRIGEGYNATADCEWDSSSQRLIYAVFYALGSTQVYQDVYFLSSSGINLNYRNITLKVSGTKTITASGTTSVAQYEYVSVAAGSAAASATKGTVSNHAVTVTPSVTRTAGWITAGIDVSGTPATVSASELVSGSQTVTQNGTVDVTNLASVVVDVQGSTPSLHVGTASTTSITGGTLIFNTLEDVPTSIAVIANGTISTSATPTFSAIVCPDLTNNLFGSVVTNTTNAQVSHVEGGFYINGAGSSAIEIVGFQAGAFSTTVPYDIIYTYGGGAIDTKQVQVGSGATSITFTGLEDEPACWYVIFQSNFSTSSGYQRVIAVANDGTDTYGLEMDSSAHYSDQHWASSYSNGSLTITSQGTNAGGYFHQPGTYLLVYAYDASGNYQSKTVTPSQSTQEVTADSGYDALRKVTVNPIPSSYVQPTTTVGATTYRASTSSQTIQSGTYHNAAATIAAVSATNLEAGNIKSGTTISISNGQSNLWSVTGTYSGGGGGSASVATTTWSNSSNTTTSHQFTNLSGTPKAAFLRCTSSLSRSSSSSNYFIADMVWDGTSCKGNSFRRSNGTYANVTSGYTVTTGSNSITFTSSGTSTTNPGSFYNGSYELTYVY